MNLIFFIDFNDSLSFGGGDYYIYKLGESLAMRENNVVMFWANLGKLKNSDSKAFLNEKFFIKETFRGSSRINSAIEKFYDYFYLEDYIRKNRGNIDYIVGYQTKNSIKAAQYAEKYNIKLANFIFETPELLFNSESFIRFKNDNYWNKCWNEFRDSLKLSDIVFSLSSLTKKSAETWVKKEIGPVVSPGIDAKKNLFPSKNKSHIIYIGRLEKSKRVDLIIHALSKIKNHPTLMICGTGSEKNRLFQLAKDLQVSAEFKGSISESEKWEFISTSYFMVFPSTFEGYGMPPMEALYLSKPCIASDLEIFRSIYGDYLDYFPVNDLEALVSKIKFLLDNPDYCEQRGTKGSVFIRQNFSWERSSKIIEDSLLELSSKHQ